MYVVLRNKNKRVCLLETNKNCNSLKIFVIYNCSFLGRKIGLNSAKIHTKCPILILLFPPLFGALF